MKPTTSVCLFLILSASLAILVFVFGRGASDPRLSQHSVEHYRESQKLTTLHRVLGEVQPGDWLESHEESGQSYSEYAQSNPIRVTQDRSVLYVLPLGEFDEQQRKIVELSAEFIGRYFMCEVQTMDPMGLDVIPANARRVHPSWGVRQIHSRYVLHDLLKPLLPDDAVALIALTSSDLYPQDDWNFVFGQASLKNRVGVWSMYRNGDPKTEFTKVLKRTLQTATHETGHMFSIEHCIAYECNMCGSNNQEESDRKPLHLCPECVAKVWLATNCDPIQRFKQLMQFCKENKLDEDASFFEQSINCLQE